MSRPIVKKPHKPRPPPSWDRTQIDQLLSYSNGQVSHFQDGCALDKGADSTNVLNPSESIVTNISALLISLFSMLPNLPPNVASAISLLSESLHNGPPTLNNTVELPQYTA
jgi:hypothetical protein